jgi:hypothetical protein
MWRKLLERHPSINHFIYIFFKKSANDQTIRVIGLRRLDRPADDRLACRAVDDDVIEMLHPYQQSTACASNFMWPFVWDYC